MATKKIGLGGLMGQKKDRKTTDFMGLGKFLDLRANKREWVLEQRVELGKI
ncbi:MAG TPA: hypothetical protein VN963_01420 [bacterium]|nr:hypothetical protein [bacterium]